MLQSKNMTSLLETLGFQLIPLRSSEIPVKQIQSFNLSFKSKKTSCYANWYENFTNWYENLLVTNKKSYIPLTL